MLGGSLGSMPTFLKDIQLYPKERLLFPAKMRGPFLSGAQPHILEVERARVLRLPVGSFRGPVERCRGTRGRHMRECIAEEYTPRVYNPSIAPAPAGLCERCAYVASVRVSHQHQCDSTGAINLGFEGAAIVLLDADFEVVAWDWWFQIPRRQLAHVEREYWGTRNFSWTPAENDASMHSTHPFFGGFAAPYPWSSYDVRVFTHGPSLMATFQCRACEAFNVPAVHLTGFRSDGRGLKGMRSWSLASHPVVAHHLLRERARYREEAAYWLAGANQALFLDGSDLWVQSWLGHVVELGSMGVAVEPPARQGSKWWLDGHDGRPPLPNATHTWKPAQLNRTGAQRYTLGGNGVPQVIGRVLRAYSHDAKWEKWADPAAFRLVERFNPGVEKKDPKTGVSRVVRVGEQFSIPYNEKRPLVSTTAHLLRVPLRLGLDRDHPRAAREVLLGVAHVHRGKSNDRDGKWRKAAHRMGKRPSAPFRWGSEYTHALYALSATPPFEPLAASGEFCIAAAGTNDACESIQMVMALTRAKRAEPGLGRRPPIIVSWGANDCEAKLGFLPLKRVEAMLQPLLISRVSRVTQMR